MMGGEPQKKPRRSGASCGHVAGLLGRGEPHAARQTRYINERAADWFCVGFPGDRGAHKAFVLPSSAVESWVGNGARGRGMRYLFLAYWLELFVFVGAPTLAWFVFFG